MKNNNKTINIIFTSDTHGWLLPINYNDNSRSTNGLCVLASAIKKYNKENTILIDLGDTIQGSPLMYFHQLKRNIYKNPAAQILNELSYDYFIPGNHDFNYGKEYLDDFMKNIQAKSLCANILYKGNLLCDKGFEIIDKVGLKVLVIGVTTKYIPNWENPKHIKDIEFLDPYEVTKDILNEYRDKVDLCVVSYHGGLEKDLLTKEEFVKDTGENQGFIMFENLKGIDILLTGHQHRTFVELISNRVVIQPGGNGAFLGAITVEYSLKPSFHIEYIDSKLVSASDYKADSKCLDILEDIESANQLFLDEIIGIVPKNNLFIKDTILARIDKHPIVDFINKIQLEATGAMLSATSLANMVTGFDKEITIRNVLSTYVYANTIVVVEITGKILKEYLEKCAEYFVLIDGKITANPRFSYPKLEHYNYDMIDGIEYVINLKNDFGNRIDSIKYQGKEILNDQIFTLALNNYRASGGGDFLMLKNLPVIKEIPFNIAELMIDFIRKNRIIDIVGIKNIILKT